MNTLISLRFRFCILPLALLTAASIRAQPLASDSRLESAGGFLGQTYSGFEYGYTQHVEGAPRALHRVGFVSSRPLGEDFRSADGVFRYNYTTGSALGGDRKQHDFAAG